MDFLSTFVASQSCLREDRLPTTMQLQLCNCTVSVILFLDLYFGISLIADVDAAHILQVPIKEFFDICKHHCTAWFSILLHSQTMMIWLAIQIAQVATFAVPFCSIQSLKTLNNRDEHRTFPRGPCCCRCHHASILDTAHDIT